MKRIFGIIIALFAFVGIYANDTIKVNNLEDVSVVGFYRNNINTGSLINVATLIEANVSQEPSHIFKNLPSVFALSDNGTEYGYGYFRIRGLDQTRINVTLDGCPWNEAEDYGTYFANSPNLMASMHSVKVERGASSSYNGVAGVAGGINMESVDLYNDTVSVAHAGFGSYNTFTSGVTYNMGDRNGWGLHIRANQSQTDGYRDYGFNNSQSFALKTGYKIADNQTIDFLSMTGYHRNGQGWLGNTAEELDVNKRANGNSKNDDDEFLTSFNRIAYKGTFDKKIVTAAVYYQMQDGSYRMDLDNYMQRMVDPTWVAGTTGALYDYALQYHMIGANFATKFKFNNANITAGVNGYNYRRTHWLGTKSVNVDPSENYKNYGNKVDIAPFVIGNYRLDKWNFIANIQYRFVQFDYKDKLDSSVKFDAKDMGTRWNFVNWGAGVEYDIATGNKFYARYNYVNREPTRSDMFGGNEWFVGDIATNEAEHAHDIEAGLEYVSDEFNININLFYMKFENELVLNGQYGLNGLPQHENAKNSYRTGVEIASEWNAFDNVWFNNNVALSKNRVKTEAYGNATHILSPALTWNTDVVYRKLNWHAGLNFNLRSEVYLDTDNMYKLPGAFTVNLNGAYRFYDNVEVGLQVNNITNRINYCTGAIGATGEILYFPMARRNVFGTVKWYF